MTQTELLSEVKAHGIRLAVMDNKLRIEAPRGALTPTLRDELSRHKAEIIAGLKPAIPALSLKTDADVVVGVFTREYQRIAKRISRVMDANRDRGYMGWTRQHEPELWRRMENARGAWDVNERLDQLKAGRIAWRDYRRLMLAWARLNVRAIKLYRLSFKGKREV